MIKLGHEARFPEFLDLLCRNAKCALPLHVVRYAVFVEKRIPRLFGFPCFAFAHNPLPPMLETMISPILPRPFPFELMARVA